MKYFLRLVYSILLLLTFLLGFALCSVCLAPIARINGMHWIGDARIGSCIASVIGGLPAAWLLYQGARRLKLPLGLKPSTRAERSPGLDVEKRKVKR